VSKALSRLRGPFRLSLVIWLVVGTIGAGGILYLTFDRETETVYVAARDLPAYHQLTPDDLRLRAVRAHGVPDDAVHDQRVLLNRYTLAPIERDRAYELAHLGPRLAAGSLTGPVMAVSASAETTMGGRLARGDQVSIVTPNTRALDALVLDVVSGPNAALILQVSPASTAGVASVRSSNAPVIVRTRPYFGP
jgi:Flp pilus assembly protein CpaB